MLGLNAFIVHRILIALNEQSGLMYSLNNHIVSNIMRIRGHVYMFANWTHGRRIFMNLNENDRD